MEESTELASGVESPRGNVDLRILVQLALMLVSSALCERKRGMLHKLYILIRYMCNR